MSVEVKASCDTNLMITVMCGPATLNLTNTTNININKDEDKWHRYAATLTKNSTADQAGQVIYMSFKPIPKLNEYVMFRKMKLEQGSLTDWCLAESEMGGGHDVRQHLRPSVTLAKKGGLHDRN